MSDVSHKRKNYIALVEDTTGNYGNYNSGDMWKVKMSNNQNVSINLSRKKARRLINNQTEYVIEKFGAVYRFNPDERLVNIKYKGFRKPEISNADTIQDLITIRRNKKR